MCVIRVNKAKSIQWGVRKAAKAFFTLAIVVGSLLFNGMFTPIHALNTIMHNASSVKAAGSSKNYGQWGNTPFSKYGKFTCNTCHTADPTVGNAKSIRSSFTSTNGTWPNGALTTGAVVFTSYTTYGKDVAHSTSTNVCEVCHSQTTHHQYAGQGTSGAHKGTIGSCTDTCHLHSNGFTPAGGGCTSCHLDPPSNAGGQAITAALGAGVYGAHTKHGAGYLAGNMKCDVCHNGSTGQTTMGSGNNLIEIGFNITNANWNRFNTATNVVYGSYTGHNVSMAPNAFSASGSGTAVGIRNGTVQNTCNVYCHGNWPGSGVTARPTWAANAGTACGSCHGASAAAPPNTLSHNLHAGSAAGYSITCITCHPSRAIGDTHLDGSVQWRFSTAKPLIGAATYTRAGATGSTTAVGSTNALAGAGSGTCATVYCHSNAADTGYATLSPSWDVAPAANCLGCHGNDLASGTPIATGRHTQHVNNPTTLGLGQNYACIDCHATTVSDNRTIRNKNLHVNKLKDYSGANAGKGTSYNETNNVCSATYCHSSGKKGIIAGGNEPAAPSWDSVTALGCNGCHGTTSPVGAPSYASLGAGTAGANSHVKHIASINITATTGCAKCHRRTIDAGVANKIKNYSGLHLSGKFNINFQPFGNRTGSYSSGKACSNTWCHGTPASPAWGGPALACNACHSANDSDTGWAGSAHKNHINTSNPGSFTSMSGNVSTASEYRFACSACHDANRVQHAAGPVSATLTAQVIFNYTSPGHAPTYAAGSPYSNDKGYYYTSGTANNCNNTYCHSSGGGVGAVVNWSTTVATSSACTTCHGSVRGASTVMNTGKHKSHMNNYTTLGIYAPTCVSCHSKTLSDNTTIKDKRLHLNKFKNLSGQFFGKASNYNNATKTCSNIYCHSNGKRGTAANFVNMTGSKTWAGTAKFTCSGCHGRSTTFGYPDYANGGAGQPTANSHSEHAINLNLNDTKGCAKCHRDTVDIYNINRINPYSSNHINGQASGDIRFDPIDGNIGTYDSATKICSATYCHGTTKSSPTWGTTITCGQYCHSDHGGVKGGTGALGGSHYKHYSSTANDDASYSATGANNSTAGTYKFTCNSCHNGLHALGPVSSKVYAQVIFNYTTNSLAGSYAPNSSGTTDSNGYKFTLGTCTNTYCHSDGNGGSKSIAWGGSVLADCTSCHGGARGSSTVMSSGMHNRHMNNWTTQGASLQRCQSCHAAVVSGNTTLINKRLHINKIKNYSGIYAGDNYNRSTKACTNFYCHSDSKGRFVNPGNWITGQGPKMCDGCHGRSANGQSSNSSGIGYPNYTSTGPGTFRANSHLKHVIANNILDTRGCAKCHRRTADRNNANRQHPLSSNHLDGNTSFDVSPDTGYGISYTYNTGSKSCNNITCHGSGRGQNGSATWGSSSLSCLGCHGGRVSASGAYATGSLLGFKLSTSHGQHLKYSATTQPFMNCNICHSKTATNAATLKPFSSAIYHANGTANVRFTGITYASVTSYKTAGVNIKKCTNTACHGGSTRSAWGTINSNNTCVHCHGVANTPTSNTDKKRYAPGWGGTGTDTDGLSVAGGLRVGAHFLHLSSVYMRQLKCNECHTVPATPYDTNAPNHMQTLRWNSTGLSFSQASSAILIGGATRTVLSAFTGYTTGTPIKAATCSSVYCHGSRMRYGDTSGSDTKPSWNRTDLTTGTPGLAECGRCHGNPPTAGSKALTHSGRAATTSCTTCHGTVVDATGNIKNKALHINGMVDASGGACDGCHSYDEVAGVWTSPDYAGLTQGIGVHAKHIAMLKVRTGVTLLPATDTFGTGNAAKICGVCHTNNVTNHTTGTPANPRSIVFDSYTAHHHDAAGPVLYNGPGTKTCSNIDCHYKTTLLWY